MQKWQCPECGELINRDISLCVCGYNENEVYDELPAKELSPAADGRQQDIPLKTIIYKTLRFVILVHLIAYAVLIGKQTAGRPHFIGKSLMLGALWTTRLYVVPISKLVGPYSFLTKPFYLIRDGFYNLGWKAFPEDDAERDMWWYAVKFSSEYCELVEDEILPYCLDKPHKLSPAYFNAWTNELYEHIDPLGTLPLRDKKLQRFRLGAFVAVSSMYVTDRGNFVGKYYNNIGYAIENELEITRLRLIFDNFLQLKEYCKKNETKAFEELFYRKNYKLYLANSFVNYLTSEIIYNNLYIRKTKLDCESALVTEHMKARKMMLEAKREEILPLSLDKVRKNYENTAIRQIAYRNIKKACNVDQYEPHQ